jgi:hypothetical protein
MDYGPWTMDLSETLKNSALHFPAHIFALYLF